MDEKYIQLEIIKMCITIFHLEIINLKKKKSKSSDNHKTINKKTWILCKWVNNWYIKVCEANLCYFYYEKEKKKKRLFIIIIYVKCILKLDACSLSIITKVIYLLRCILDR